MDREAWCANSWGRKELDMTEWLSWTDTSNKMQFTQILDFFLFSLQVSSNE